jgi:anti-anti-sigma factor
LKTFRVVGPASMAVSGSLRRSVEADLEQGATVRIDLRECTWMDSTFLGTLLVLAREARASRRGARFSLVSPSDECSTVLDHTGVREVIEVIATPKPEATEWTEIARDGDKEALACNILHAHQELAAFPGTEGAFREVARSMTEGAQLVRELPEAGSPERKEGSGR